ncbi:MAG: putative Ig domain-containing protein [Peptoniphilaceae bacterium]|nr:putative Ig domain-containing protein [Peptoniphilaceae bacterium]
MYPQEINTKRTITTNDGVFVYGDDPFDIYGKDKATIEPKKFEFVENAPEFLEIDEKTGIISFKHDAPDEFVNKKLEIKVKVTYEDDSFDYAFSEIYIDENEEDIEKSYMDVNYSYDEVHPFPVDLYWLGNYFEGDDTLKFIYKVYPGVSEGNKFVLKNLDGEVLGELLVDPYNEEEYTEKDVYLVNDWEPLNARIGIIKIKDPSKMGKASDMYRFELEPADKNLKNFDFSSYSGLRLDENGPSFISFPMVYLKPELSDEILTVPINGSLKEFAREPFLTENYERAFYNFFKQADKALYNRIEWVEKPSTKTPGLKYGKVKVTSQFGRVIPYGERYLELPFFDVSILDKNPEELDKYSFEHFGRSERVNYIEHSKWEFEVPILVEFGIKPIEDKEYTEEEKIDEIAVEILRTNITKGKVIAEIKELPEYLTFEYDKEKEIGRITGKSPKINDWKEDEEERNYEITVTAKDEEGNETLETFTIKIKKDKIPPKVTPIDDKTVVEGVEITPIPVTTDDKKAIVTVEGLPDGLTYNKETGQIEGVPTKKDDWGDDKEKEIKVTVKAKDENNNESTPVEFTITLQRDTDGDTNPDVTDKDDEGKSIPLTDI